MALKRYDGKNCPCPSDCVRRGKCKECIKFHHQRGEETYCEYLYNRTEGTTGRAVTSGKEIRLLEYAPCAG